MENTTQEYRSPEFREWEKRLELPVVRNLLEELFTRTELLQLSSETGRTQFVNDAIASEKPLLIVRNGAGPLHIAVQYKERIVTRCGMQFKADKVTLFRSKAAVTAVWEHWSRKCGKCRAGIL